MSRVEWTYLSSGNDAEIHRHLHPLLPRSLEHLTLVTNHIGESLGVLCSNGNLGAIESISNTNRWEGLAVAEPETPVGIFDVQVAAVCNLINGDRTKGRDNSNSMDKGTAIPRRSSKAVISMALVLGVYLTSTVLNPPS